MEDPVPMFGTQPHEPLPNIRTLAKLKKDTDRSDKKQLQVQIDSGDESYEGNEDDLVFSIDVLRAPTYKCDKKTR